MSAVLKLTAEQIDREVRRLAEEQPDFRYNPHEEEGCEIPMCFYSSGLPDGPACSGCIFGQALQRLGVPVDLLEEADKSPDSIYHLRLRGVDFPHGRDQPPHWVWIQRAQDRGATWGEAVAKHMPVGAGREEVADAPAN